MSTFYAKYPSTSVTPAGVSTVQGEGTAGTPVGGILTVQGDPAGTPVPVSGSITATNPSVGVIGAADPSSGTYVGVNNGGNLIGALGDSAGRQIVAGAGTPGLSVGGVLSIQGVAVGTAVPVSGTVTANQGGAPWAANITQWGGNSLVVGTGVGGAGVPRVTVSSDSSMSISAGTAIIGKVSIDQTTPGTTNGVQVNAALPAGSNKIGAISTVDTVTAVTTVSTVTAVTAITNALPSGTNILGRVGIDQTTPGTTNGVQVNAALPAGTAIIGKFGIDQTTPGTTNGVVVNTAAPVTTTTAAFQAEGAVAFGSITNSYVTLFTPTAATKILQMRNNTNAAISVSMDAGSTTNYTLDAGDAVSLDLLANALNMGATAIQVKYAVGAPTSGSFRINGCH